MPVARICQKIADTVVRNNSTSQEVSGNDTDHTFSSQILPHPGNNNRNDDTSTSITVYRRQPHMSTTTSDEAQALAGNVLTALAAGASSSGGLHVHGNLNINIMMPGATDESLHNNGGGGDTRPQKQLVIKATSRSYIAWFVHGILIALGLCVSFVFKIITLFLGNFIVQSLILMVVAVSIVVAILVPQTVIVVSLPMPVAWVLTYLAQYISVWKWVGGGWAGGSIGSPKKLFYDLVGKYFAELMGVEVGIA